MSTRAEHVAPDHAEPSPADQDLTLSLVRDDPPFRALRSVGLIPPTGLGLVRRAIFFALLSWLPIAIWSWTAGRAISTEAGEPLLQHFGVHVRCLVAIPILILAQGLAHSITTHLLPWFVKSGVITPDKVSAFRNVVHGMLALRNHTLPWVMIAAVVIVVAATGPVLRHLDELSWAMDSTKSPPEFGFGGWWFLFVARPIYAALVLGWLWRVVLLTVLFYRITKLGLEIVPTHPDRAGGLGFVEHFAKMFIPVVFVLSAAVGSHWAHNVLYHDMDVQSLRVPFIIFLIVMLFIFITPLLVFFGPLRAARKQALLEYGALVGQHGDFVRRRWILHEKLPNDDVLNAPELGPVADTVSLYDAIERMRMVPIGKSILIMLGIPALIPLLLVFAIKVPIADILMKLLHAVG